MEVLFRSHHYFEVGEKKSLNKHIAVTASKQEVGNFEWQRFADT